MMYNFNDVMDELLGGLTDVFKEANQKEGMLKSDVLEYEDRYEVLTDIPGVNKEDISLSFDEGTLTISVKNNRPKEEGKVIFKEREFASEKKIFMQTDVDSDGMKAKYENGVLSITMPKKMPKKTNIVIE